MKNRIIKFGSILVTALVVFGLYACAQPSNDVKKSANPVKVLPEGTDGTAGTSATYVEFGLWPQTVLPSTSDVQVDETISKTMGMFTCYKGSDNEWYVKCEENALFTFNYTDNTEANSDGAYTRYFKVEPIKWRVLTENYNNSGKKLLVAEKALVANQPYNYGTEVRTIGTNSIYANNYMHSRIRAYLNGSTYYNSSNDLVDILLGKGFLQSAFTLEEISLISETEVDNSAASTGYSENQYACDNTIDKIFLLSNSEVSNGEYGFTTDSTRCKKPTDYAIANGIWYYTPNSPWWLRSPNTTDKSAFTVSFDGKSIASDDDYTSQMFHGVVPALTISF